MLGISRQDKIRTILNEKGAVLSTDLVKLFGVSIETVRRDLLEMEKAGALKRVHGGAVSVNEMQRSHTLVERHCEYLEEKKNLSQNATMFVNDGDYIAIDGGSTGIFFAEEIKIKAFNNLTVVTPSLDVFNILNGVKGIEVILCGGIFCKEENYFYGSLTINMLESLHCQKAFIFPSAVSLKFGIASFQNDFVTVQRKMMEISDSVYILADHSKFENKALLKICDMKKEYTYITDSDLSSELKTLYSENEYVVIN